VAIALSELWPQCGKIEGSQNRNLQVVESMADIDDKTWIEQAQEYERLCRRTWLFSLGLAVI
jgi:hypothetical protein